MLSHHEFATLLLVNGSAVPTEMDCEDIEALLARQLVTLERLGPNRSRLQVTIQGYVLLKALDRVRAKGCRAYQVCR